MFVIDHSATEVPMTNVPAGAQVSDDGNYWWDGTAWQPVTAGVAGQQTAAGAEAATPEEMPKLEHAWGESLLAEVDVPEMQDDAAGGMA
jgi:hypothetical protein